MKKTLSILLAAATLLAACTKSEIAYEQPQEIGFNVVAGNITKAPVDGTTYPTDLNMYIYAQTTDKTDGSTNYITNGEFAHKGAYSSINTESTDATAVWAGTPDSYYWPNVHKLNFAGYSKSGNVATGATVTYSFLDNSGLKITNYTPGSSDNDLMWFCNTAKTTAGANGYGKDTDYVPAEMYHTCSWLTFMIKGDAGTNGYTITNMSITGIDNTGDVMCYNVKPTDADQIQWTNNAAANETLAITLSSNLKLSDEATNVETGAATAVGGNIVVIPQTPGSISITYQSTNTNVDPETVTGSLALGYKVTDGTAATTQTAISWEPGKHYVYTITIKANEILIAPNPVDWTDSNWNITIE